MIKTTMIVKIERNYGDVYLKVLSPYNSQVKNLSLVGELMEMVWEHFEDSSCQVPELTVDQVLGYVTTLINSRMTELIVLDMEAFTKLVNEG